MNFRLVAIFFALSFSYNSLYANADASKEMQIKLVADPHAVKAKASDKHMEPVPQVDEEELAEAENPIVAPAPVARESIIHSVPDPAVDHIAEHEPQKTVQAHKAPVKTKKVITQKPAPTKNQKVSHSAVEGTTHVMEPTKEPTVESVMAEHTEKHETAPKTKKASSHHAKTDAVDAEKALGWLKNGNRRFTKGFLRADGLKSSDRQRLTKGQHPHSIIISCSDSRVPPEIVFDQRLGEVFIIRTAGQALDLNAIASVEYAVEHLGTKLIVVMGHESCGAVAAALDTLGGKDAGSPALNALVRDIQPRVNEFASKPRSKNIEDESWANVRGVAQDLVERSSILRDKVMSGELQVHQALYHLGSGQVDFSGQAKVSAR